MPMFPPQLGRDDYRLLRLLRFDADQHAGGVEPDTDWPTILQMARRHQILPLVLSRMAALPPDVPAAPPPGPLRRLRRAVAIQSLLQDRDLVRAAGALAATGISPLILKGPAVGRLAYGDPALRACEDIDFLVPLADYDAALRAVTAAGFQTVRRFGRKEDYHDLLRGPGGTKFELHWGLSRPGNPVQLDPTRFLAHGVPSRDQIPANLTSPTDLLLHTAAQALDGRFRRLYWIVDVDRLLRRCEEEIDWERLREDAGQAGLSSALWLLFRLADRLLATPEPPVQDALAPQPWVRYGLASLSPARSLVTGFSLRYNILQGLFDFWLAPDFHTRLRAASQFVRVPPAWVPPGAPAPTRGERSRHAIRSQLLNVKAALYQGCCLVLRPLRGD